jgi:hypothetical protein
MKGQNWKRGDEVLDYSIEEYDMKSAISKKCKYQQIQEGPATINFNQDPSHHSENIISIGHLQECSFHILKQPTYSSCKMHLNCGRNTFHNDYARPAYYLFLSSISLTFFRSTCGDIGLLIINAPSPASDFSRSMSEEYPLTKSTGTVGISFLISS